MKKYNLDINDENIQKTIEENILGRNKQLVTLGKILLNNSENLIIAIDGQWGSGKTFFVKQFEYIIKNIEIFIDNRIFVECDKEVFKSLNEKNIIIYYNAWENDTHDNPLESIVYQILNDFPEQKNQLTSFSELKKVLKKFLQDAIKTCSINMFDISNFDKIQDYKTLTSSIVTIEEKKDSFNKLINNILGKEQRLVLIIDELDRCKPTFAVKLLEIIKHFYNNEKISIIISTNNKELSHTIKKFYGNLFDGYRYLDKFYDIILTLECNDRDSYLKTKLCFKGFDDLTRELSVLIMKYYNFSLRDCNKFVTFYRLLRPYFKLEEPYNRKENYIVSGILIPFALALKIKDIEKYNNFINRNGQAEIEEFLDYSIEGSELGEWLKETLKINNSDYKQTIVDCYKKMIEGQSSIYVVPFFEAISMLGTHIKVDD